LSVNFANKYALQSLSLSYDEVVNHPVLEILPGEAARNITSFLKTGQKQTKYRLLSEEPGLISSIALLGSSELKGIICSFLPISELTQTISKEKLYQSLQGELESLLSSSQHGNWLCDGNGTVLSMNKAAEELNGLDARGIIGKKACSLQDEGHVDHSVTGQVVKQKRRLSTIQYIIKTGKYLLVTATPVFNERNEIYRIVVNEKDITGLQTLRNSLKHSEMIAEKLRDEISELSILNLKNNKIIAENEEMKHVLKTAVKLARANVSNIIILGESGTGKGLLAEFIHNQSLRNAKSFIQINCAGLPESLLEAELYGYEKGAFTGAKNHGKVGLIELAQNGTLFLDEIGDMSLSLQSKLLTYLDNYMLRSVGGVREKYVPTNIIAATNKNLTDLVKKGLFREDLFYRLNSFVITIPPIRERPEDIFALTRFFLAKYNKKYQMEKQFSKHLYYSLQSYSFPGNVRELKSIIEQAVVMGENEHPDKIIIDVIGAKMDTAFEHHLVDQLDFTANVELFEKKLLKNALQKYPSTRKLAGHLGISQSKVTRKLRKYNLQKSES